MKMKEIIPKDDYGVFVDGHDVALVDSRYVAQYFEKRHDHVIRDIGRITAPKSGLSEDFRRLNFQPSSYKDASGKKNLCYLMTRDGFTMLTMGYTGKKGDAVQRTLHPSLQRNGTVHPDTGSNPKGISAADGKHQAAARPPEAVPFQQ